MFLDYSHGGLRAPNIELMSKSLKLAWITRLLRKEQPWEQAWKTIPNHFLNKYGSLNFLLKCNYNEKCLRQTGNLPQFYKSMLQHFLELKVAYNCAIGQDLVLFNNKEILIESQTIFYKEWFHKEIFLIQDFLHENGQHLFQEFIQRYDVEYNFLKYRQVVSAIPKRLFNKAKEKQVDKDAFLAENAFQLSPNTTIDLHKMKNKDFYWLLRRRVKYGLDPWTFGLFFGLFFGPFFGLNFGLF